MPEHETDSQKTYSTGELANACGVSVRAVQYYDEKGILPPSDLTTGGRRIYTEADAAKLRKVLLLKSLGLRLAEIKSFLESAANATVLRDILEEQDARIAAELEERAAARVRIAAMIAELDRTGELPAETDPGVEDIMQKVSWRKSELAPVYRRMLVIGMLIDIPEVAVIAWWIVTGDWKPFAVAMPLVIVACAFLVRYYRKRTAYVCPHCRSVFVPKTAGWFFAPHTPTTRKVTCTSCGTKDWCAEVPAERLATNR